jgi:hypothetical protein
LQQVRSYQLHLINQKRSWSHIKQVACALRFFYGIALGSSVLSGGVVGTVNGRNRSTPAKCLDGEARD